MTCPGAVIKKCPSTYKHSDLPNGKDLHGEPLKNTLMSIFSEYATDIVVNKLSPCANSQRNESVNSTIATTTTTKKIGGTAAVKVVTSELHVE